MAAGFTAAGDAVIASAKQPFYKKLYVQVLAAIVAGALLGHFWPELGISLKPLGDGFIKLVKMIIAPVIFLTVASGIAGMRDLSSVGSVAGKALAYFLFFSTLALIIGLIVGNVVQPGAGLNIDPATLDSAAVETYAQSAEEQTIAAFLLDIIPTTLFSAMTDGKILQVLLVAILTGVALAATRPHSDLVLDVIASLSEAIFKLVHMLMKLAPIGAFGAIAFTIGEFGITSLANLAALVATFYLTSLLFVFGVLGIVARLAGFSIFALIKYLREELLLVLGTSSSEAALPSLMEKMEIAGCRKAVVGLVVPTGYSFNLDGTNIYMTLAALFIAQAVGIELSLGEQLALVLVAMISSKRGGRCDRGRVCYPGGDIVGRSLSPGCRNGADTGNRPVYERMPGTDEFHRQCSGHNCCRQMGKGARHRQVGCSHGRQPHASARRGYRAARAVWPA